MYRLLIMADVLDASYSVLLKYSLEHLVNQGELALTLLSGNEVTEKNVRRAISRDRTNVAIFLRYSGANALQLCDLCRENGASLVYLIDDDFFALAETANAEIYGRHTSAQVLKTRADLLTSVKYVICSTLELKLALEARFNLNQVLSPLPPIYLNSFPMHRTSFKSIGYMGSKGHKFDLEMIAPAIAKLLEEFQDLRFETFGTIGMPVELERFGTRVSSHGTERRYEDFLRKLSTLGWHFALAPLVDNRVNRCKTFVKFLEYTSAGIPVIASNVNVYAEVAGEGRGYLVQDGEWYEKMVQVIAGPCDNSVHLAREYSQRFALEGQVRNLQLILETISV